MKWIKWTNKPTNNKMESIAKHGQQINNSNAFSTFSSKWSACTWSRIAHTELIVALVQFYVHCPLDTLTLTHMHISHSTHSISWVTKLIKILWLFVELVGWLVGVGLFSFINIASVLHTVHTACFQLQFSSYLSNAYLQQTMLLQPWFIRLLFNYSGASSACVCAHFFSLQFYL